MPQAYDHANKQSIIFFFSSSVPLKPLDSSIKFSKKLQIETTYYKSVVFIDSLQLFRINSSAKSTVASKIANK